MAKCDYCGTTILFGGVKEEEYRFCNQKCHENGFLLTIAKQIPDDVMEEHLKEVHDGQCPKCGGAGPIDVHTSHTVWSALVMTSWKSRPEVCCNSCGVKAKLGGAVISGLFGWWGFPWGIIMTPIQIIRNVAGLASSPDPLTPSAQLENFVRLNLASHLVASGGSQDVDQPE